MTTSADPASLLAGALRDAASKPWAIQQDRAAGIAALVADAKLGRPITTERFARAIGTGARALVETPEPKRIRSGSGEVIAVVRIVGILLYDFHLPPLATSARWLAATIRELAADKDITGILLDIDSPGGIATGVPEASDAIFAARKAGKTVVALINPLAASAAYWLASQANEIVAVPSAEIGSIGVFMLHVDISGALEKQGIKPTFIFAGEHKTEGNPLEPLDPEAQKFFQSQVDIVFRQFNEAVARGRGTIRARVERDFGQGRTFFSPEALRRDMIDGIATIEEVLSAAPSLLRRGERGATAPGGGAAVVSLTPPRRSDEMRRLLTRLRHGLPRPRTMPTKSGSHG